MPFEAFVVEPGSDGLSGNRKHETVAKEITEVFEKIKERGGKFVTAFALADRVTTSESDECVEPNGAAYIVAEFPEANS
jgi:hypothetical protein